MKILISIEHPAWAHQFKYLIRELEKRGHSVKVVAIKKDIDLELMNIFNIRYEIISNTSGRNIIEKGIIFLKTTLKIYQISKKFKPDIFIGRASPMMAINNFLFRKKHIIFEDSEPSIFCLFICKLFSDVIITPNGFKKNLGKKQVRINAYKELFYLHLKYFTPDPTVLSELNLSPNDKFIILRFVAWDAHHDIGRHGIKNKIEIVKELEKYAPVFISSEASLPTELEKYILPSSPEKIHDFLYYAKLFVSDSQTMTTEAGVLGTPAIRCNTFVGENDMGNFIELEQRYGLIFNYSDQNKAITKAIELVQKPEFKEEWKKKRENLLKDKIDVTAFMVWFIENYPDSFKEMKENLRMQYRFK
jgi:predicted glycosyltransferase